MGGELAMYKSIMEAKDKENALNDDPTQEQVVDSDGPLF